MRAPNESAYEHPKKSRVAYEQPNKSDSTEVDLKKLEYISRNPGPYEWTLRNPSTYRGHLNLGRSLNTDPHVINVQMRRQLNIDHFILCLLKIWGITQEIWAGHPKTGPYPDP